MYSYFRTYGQLQVFRVFGGHREGSYKGLQHASQFQRPHITGPSIATYTTRTSSNEDKTRNSTIDVVTRRLL